MVSVTLSGDVHDVLLSYQREGEQLPETLDRVFGAFVPHASVVKRADVDPTEVDRETSVIHQRWPDEDGNVDSRVYPHPTAYMRQFADFEDLHPVVRHELVSHDPEIEKAIAEADVDAEEIVEELEEDGSGE